MVRIEPFSGNRLITIISKPLCDLLERPILLSEMNNRIVKKVLVSRVKRGIRESCRGKCRSETEVIFNLWNPWVGNYSTVTLFAKFRGWSTSVPLSTAT